MTDEGVKTFQTHGRPSAKPSGTCGVCVTQLGSEVGFCEVDWRWEHKAHLSSQMHGNRNETKDRSEPIVLKTRKDGKWFSEQVV